MYVPEKNDMLVLNSPFKKIKVMQAKVAAKTRQSKIPTIWKPTSIERQPKADFNLIFGCI